MHLKKDLIVTKKNQTDFADLVQVSGDVYVEKGASLDTPRLKKRLESKGYRFDSGKIDHGLYLNINEKEKGYLKKIKPLIESDKLVMSKWHESDAWKNQTIDEVIDCGTTHCVAGWIQIFEKDKFNGMHAKECGERCAPNLKSLFYMSEEAVELAIETLFRAKKSH